MKPLRKIAFVLEDFTVGSPGQQLLDRFLIGYFAGGQLRRSAGLQVALWMAQPKNAATNNERPVSARERDFQLLRASSLRQALEGADAVVMTPRAGQVAIPESLLGDVLRQANAGSSCFVHGCLATGRNAARRLVQAAADRRIPLVAATSVASTFRLPDIDVAAGTRLDEALIVVQGAPEQAELEGIDALAHLVSRRRGGESGIRAVRPLDGADLWRAGEQRDWSWPLLAAALSRSNTAQGDAERDGRTQDLVGLGLVQKLARDPRGWIIEHRDGFRSALLVLNGVVADFNFAVRAHGGAITSAQLYRPPAPNRSEFDRLAGLLEQFFTTGKSAWTSEHTPFVSEFMGFVTAGSHA